MYPGLTVLEGSAGGKQTFRVTGARTNSGATRPDAFYRAPGTEPAETSKSEKTEMSHLQKKHSGGVSFAPGVAPEVVIERARSSHVLVRPLIDGVDVGPFILDTGASGLVITKAAAARLPNCASFGEVFVSGVSGKVPCRFRRASRMTLGPIVIDAPVFMEMALGGIVSGSVEPVAGIVGFDAFKSAVVEVGPGGAPVRIYDPRTFEPDANWAWHDIALVSNVPHAFATFSTVDDDDDDETSDEDATSSSLEADLDGSADRPKKASAVFMIDSGAGGADAIFHKRAVETLGLRRLIPPPAAGGARGASRVRGVGGSDGESSGATRAYRGELRWLELDKVSAPNLRDDETRDDAFSPKPFSPKPKPSRSKSKKSRERPAKKKRFGRSLRESQRASRRRRGVRLERTQRGFDLRQRAEHAPSGVRRAQPPRRVFSGRSGRLAVRESALRRRARLGKNLRRRRELRSRRSSRDFTDALAGGAGAVRRVRAVRAERMKKLRGERIVAETSRRDASRPRRLPTGSTPVRARDARAIGFRVDSELRVDSYELIHTVDYALRLRNGQSFA